MNKLLEMEIFVQVVDAGSLAAAARKLRRNPSSVSKFMSALEDRLGVLLLTRTKRDMVLTDAGENFLLHCKDILSDIDEAEQAATATARPTEPRGRLRVIGMDTCSPSIMIPLISGFAKLYPGIQMDLNHTDYGQELVGTQMDVALRIGELTAKGLKCVQLAPSYRLICASPEYLATHGTPQSLASLAEHNCIGFSTPDQSNTWQLPHNGQSKKIQPCGNLVANNAELIRQAALSGAGICQLSNFIIGPDIQEGRLVLLFPEQQEVIDDYVCAIYPRKKITPEKTLIFVKYLKQQLSLT
ncbi:MAG: hypothetical protein OFPI_27700 [Osedax symbiont Rs2]|nr:MAG: hypothetical protein OFPI_27700 [Osedax symbiont Rs2]